MVTVIAFLGMAPSFIKFGSSISCPAEESPTVMILTSSVPLKSVCPAR
jgi:hypothetical protein